MIFNKEIIPPSVSIVIPSFNKADLLIEMIKSIIRQTYKDWELIIVDDGSDEENFNEVHSFVSADSRITHIRRNREPKNGDTCRNIGMEMAKGEYLIIFDSDDIITPTCLEKRVAFMQAHPDCDYASFPYGIFQDGNKNAPDEAQKLFNVVTANQILSSLLKGDYPFTVWSNIYRRKAVQKILWDEKVFVYQDFDFMVNCALKGLSHEYGDSELDYYYRQFSDGSNVCGDFISKQKCDSTLYLFEKTIKSLIDNNLFVKNKKDFLNGLILIHYKRLLLGSDRTNIKAFIDMCSKYFCTFRFRLMAPINSKKNGQSRIHALSLALLLLYGDIRPLKDSLKRRFVK